MSWESFLLTLYNDKYGAMYADYTKKIFVVSASAKDKAATPKRKRK